MRQLKSLDETLAAYGEAVETLAAAPRYREPVKALTCYKGVKNLFALTMITEIGDVKRFAHPRQLVSWFGMDIREYASGGKSHRFGITRQGNRYRRTAFIEANQRRYRSAQLGKDLKARRANSAPRIRRDCRPLLTAAEQKGQSLATGRQTPEQGESSLCSGDGGIHLGITEPCSSLKSPNDEIHVYCRSEYDSRFGG